MMPPLSQFTRLEVEPLLELGEDPRGAIMKRLSALAADEGLLVCAPFLPSPLIEMLGGMGFSAKVEPGGNGEWLVYFWSSTNL